jgi:putative colanic acid biosynthesis UDP-glucose lipid carrier transferase
MPAHGEAMNETPMEEPGAAPDRDVAGSAAGSIPRVSRFFPVAEALMAAAHADRPASDLESDAVRRVLCELLAVEKLPDRLEERLRSFDPGRVDVKVLADQLVTSPVAGRHTLMELTAQICQADGQLDLSEDRYILALAFALGLEPQEYGHIVYDSPFRGAKRLLKRIEDLALATFFLIFSAPVMIAIALAIKLTSRGPVLFRQRRHGEDGVEFSVLKFRSMSVMENGAAVVQARRHDARITPVGAFLRRTSLDELPQFLNVLAGNMSIVGPRPHAIAHNELYRTKILEYMRRHKVKPGITGWAQVNGLRGETDTLEKMVARVEHDLQYIRGWSLWLDLKIVFLTIFGRKVRQNAY